MESTRTLSNTWQRRPISYVHGKQTPQLLVRQEYVGPPNYLPPVPRSVRAKGTVELNSAGYDDVNDVLDISQE